MIRGGEETSVSGYQNTYLVYDSTVIVYPIHVWLFPWLQGHVTSYCGLELQKYTSLQVHATDEIRQITTLERGMLSLTQSKLRCSLRRGITLFDYT
jgi:hypothetical protein